MMFRLPIVVILTCSILVALVWAGPTGRIVGGDNAKLGEFKHQVSLRQLGSHVCGGSIISRDYILTAAHCVTSTTKDNQIKYLPANIYSIRAGSIDQFKGGEVVPVASIIVHEKYGNFLNDLAVLKLTRSLTFSDTIAPIPLAQKALPENTDVLISGWGRIATGGISPQYLKFNTLHTVSTLSCSFKVGMNANSLVCLGHQAGNGACNGDSGGPAIYNGELVGVAGFVVGGCGSNNPDGYAKVSYHLDWIKAHSDV